MPHEIRLDHLRAATLSALLLLGLPTAGAHGVRTIAVPGEKIDSGLGELPRYGQVVGQKVDSGLGELPHYRDWADKTGRAPVRQHEQVAKADPARK